MLDKDGFRLNVVTVIVNHNNDVLLAKRIKQNAWQFPQGGIDDDEDTITAMYRELQEEIGLEQKDVSIIASSKSWLKYKIPPNLREGFSPLCIGQKQKWFLLRFHGENNNIKLDLSYNPEFDAWQWVSYWYPLRVIVEFKKKVYIKALKEFSSLIKIIKC